MSVYPKSGHTEHPPMALSVPWDPSWEAKTIEKHWKSMVVHKFTKNKFCSVRTRDHVKH